MVADVSGTVIEDTPKAVTLPGTDADGDALTYAVVTLPLHGAVTVSGGTATYTPTLNYHGADSFTYKANDGTVDSATATVSITVTPVNDAPVADPFAETADGGVAKSFDLRGSDVDNLVTTRTATITVQPQHGTATLSGLRVTYTPNISYSGNDTLKYTLSDGAVTSNEAQVTIVVSPSPVVQPTPTGKLNDTGITLCGDYAYGGSGTHNSDVNCALTVDADSDPVPPSIRIDGAGNATGQDGHVGRDADAATNDNADGSAGFNFTKISSTGEALPASATEWSCVKDNVTGRIWEVKTNDGGLHDKDWTYTWFDTNTATNGGGNGTADGGSCGSPATSQCDTSGYVTAVNTAGWCGATSD